MLSPELLVKVRGFQKRELTEHLIYRRMAECVPAGANRDVLLRLSDDEKRHYEIWKKYSGQEVAVDHFQIWVNVLLARVFGLTFGIKLAEKGEEDARTAYAAFGDLVPEVRSLIQEEAVHEEALVAMLDEDQLKYVGSVVLGLSDALVELTGVLAGLTFALANARLIAAVGLITGVAAAFSMAASEYLSTKTEGGERSPLKASVYTGVAYIFTVVFLIAPYLLLNNLPVSLAWTMLNAVLVIVVFTFYAAVTQGVSFRKRFAEMTLLCFGVAALSFGFGYLVKQWLGVSV
ncbi:MAG: rubrerythrin family protein [Candidatus Omnitrophica bacterium]|nr:rubrerythrin family protein [Candidatus Omnitrophota bacterium]